MHLIYLTRAEQYSMKSSLFTLVSTWLTEAATTKRQGTFLHIISSGKDQNSKFMVSIECESLSHSSSQAKDHLSGQHLRAWARETRQSGVCISVLPSNFSEPDYKQGYYCLHFSYFTTVLHK